MCGIAGYWDRSNQSSPAESQRIVTAMTDTLITRGPDSSGIWLDPAAGVALGHRRLAILDLSPEGAQPMLSTDGRYAIVFNGEIYNFAVLRTELSQQGYQFRGHSDTEVMLAAVTEWGLTVALQKFVGMFAFALWDTQERVLHLCRDRAGEKPLYYGWVGDTLLFGSELKALVAHPQWQGKIDRSALTLFVRYGYIPAPHSIYEGISKLTPGTTISFNSEHPTATPIPYWDLQTVVEKGMRDRFQGTDAEAIAQLDKLLREIIQEQMVADVPLGAFLSGGIDSSTIVALMQAQSTRPIKTFSIGFTEQQYNEAEYAKSVAAHLGTEHTELYVTPADALGVIPQLPQLYDEPFADPSQIPTFLLSKMTREHVTVSLSGDAGDELFGGYSRYFIGIDIWQKISWIPLGMRQFYAKLLMSVPPKQWDGIVDRIGQFAPKLQNVQAGRKIHKIAGALASKQPLEMYRELLSTWKNPADIVLNSTEPATIVTHPPDWLDLQLDFAERMMYLDMMSYLPDDILVKVDRAAMAVSLESRVPFLDRRAIEFAWQLPLSMKLRNNQGKWLLRQVLYQYVPSELIDRPKMGFGVPIDSWLRAELRDWAESLLAEQRLEREGFFNVRAVRQQWDEHLSGEFDRSYALWNILMFQAWLEEHPQLN